MWVQCRCGSRHFGPYGAAGLVVRDAAGLVLMAHRSTLVHFPGTWSFPGGALERGESPVAAALREIDEELGVPRSAVTVVQSITGTDHEDWRYTYVIADLVPQWTDVPVRLNWETEAVAWVELAEMAGLSLHPGVRADLPALHAALARVTR
ncbi:MAG TPA: NUDIX hydrolase [Micromonosporaceae bacterium]|jgi:8-oxo-dGTP pyrophosphatase MutT (NUDIX family)